jgi:hypothetical protein
MSLLNSIPFCCEIKIISHILGESVRDQVNHKRKLSYKSTAHYVLCNKVC